MPLAFVVMLPVWCCVWQHALFLETWCSKVKSKAKAKQRGRTDWGGGRGETVRAEQGIEG